LQVPFEQTPTPVHALSSLHSAPSLPGTFTQPSVLSLQNPM
jgi:hypothetical protein